jgi:hypothetical protein
MGNDVRHFDPQRFGVARQTLVAQPLFVHMGVVKFEKARQVITAMHPGVFVKEIGSCTDRRGKGLTVALKSGPQLGAIILKDNQFNQGPERLQGGLLGKKLSWWETIAHTIAPYGNH